MLAGLAGSLVTEYFAEELLLDLFGAEADGSSAASARLRLARERRRVSAGLGPVCGPRQVLDLVSLPLVTALGFQAGESRPIGRGTSILTGLAGPQGSPLLVTTGWGESLDGVWREAVRASIAAAAPWCLCVNGRQVRLVDGRRTYARRYLQFDIDSALDDQAVFAVLWALLRRDSFAAAQRAAGSARCLVDRVVEASDRNAAGVCRSLREGVLEALAELLTGIVRAGSRPEARIAAGLERAHQQALTIVYRILFLLFAEARRLVPSWHPVYRESYSIDAARLLAERPGAATGLWEMLQAISRLLHAGCEAGDLRVTPFNGRLFSPGATPLADSLRLTDETARRVVLALSTAPRKGGRARISYRDLDVEQLGAVYESVLDYAPRAGGSEGRVCLEPGSGLRKTTASFYTPRPITSYLVRRVLSPLVSEASPEAVLALRVVDPAMGSGAFLVAACRFLASAYEAALVRSGRCLPCDIDDADRRGFRRAVAQRCLYGVDLNPMAVQLARLSLWLATLAPDRPLTFLDHRLLVGDSLVGATLDDVLLRPPPGSARGRPRADVPLFGPAAAGPDLAVVVPLRAGLAERPDDTVEAVRNKERQLDAASGPHGPIARWKGVLDLWCAQAFVPEGDRAAGPGVFAAVADLAASGRSSLPEPAARRCLDAARAAMEVVKPCHWTLEFPEIFYDERGTPRDRPGFDAVVGNPPWDMIRADAGDEATRRLARDPATRLLRFARGSGIYRAQGNGHGNLVQLFVERAFQLARTGGRVGLVLPWGVAADHGHGALRRLLFDRASIDPIVGFDNQRAIFPIHRSVRFFVLSATSGGTTGVLQARLGERDVTALDRIPASGGGPEHFPVALSRSLLEELSGDGLAVPDARTGEDARLLEKLRGAGPVLSARDGWGAEFGRELNASEDRRHFAAAGRGLPVLEGKHLEPFRAMPGRAASRLPRRIAATLLDPRAYSRPRLAYRDVASATNRLTLIAAVVPAGCVTVHSVFCLRTPLAARAQSFLCGVLNSLVANYYVRFFVTTHVTTAIVARLPVPRPATQSGAFLRISALAAALSRAADPLARPAYAELQAEVALLYGLTGGDLRQVVDAFPLIGDDVKRATLAAFAGRAGPAPGGRSSIEMP